MKRTTLFLGILAIAGILAVSCDNTPKSAQAQDGEATETGASKGDIVYFNLDRVLEEYDMANDLRSVVETKVGSINQEVNRRGSKLEKESERLPAVRRHQATGNRRGAAGHDEPDCGCNPELPREVQ